MTLELSADDAHELKAVLESTEQRLLEELAHADVREFRMALRRRLEAIQSLDRQVSELLETPPMHA